MSVTLSPSSGQAFRTNGNTVSTCGTAKAARPLGARGEGNTQVIPTQEKGATATVAVVKSGRTPMGSSFGGGQGFNPYGGHGMDPFGRGGGGGGYQPYGGPNPYQGRVASKIGERDGPMSATTSSRPQWTYILTGTVDKFTWPRCSTWPASGKRIYRCCHGSAMQIADRSCAGRAHWDSACTTNDGICKKVDTPVLTASRMTFLTKPLVPS